ncbi:GNAT family N-acetyltransferase [Vibrio owensii]|uniref:GNAT family N-acetyltransferase n=1 Tax=Vibrio owensii TaxID=696485 RepID=UPI004068430D
MLKRVSSENPSVVSLTRDCFQELRAIYSPNKTAKPTSSKDEWVNYAYYLEGRIVGCVKAKLTDDELQLSGLAVESASRKQGIARRLIMALCELYSVNALSVWCVEETGNVEIFKALGFEVLQTESSSLFSLTNGSPATEVKLGYSIRNTLG